MLQAQPERSEVDDFGLRNVFVIPEAILDANLDGLSNICEGFFVADAMSFAILEE